MAQVHSKMKYCCHRDRACSSKDLSTKMSRQRLFRHDVMKYTIRLKMTYWGNNYLLGVPTGRIHWPLLFAPKGLQSNAHKFSNTNVHIQLHKSTKYLKFVWIKYLKACAQRFRYALFAFIHTQTYFEYYTLTLRLASLMKKAVIYAYWTMELFDICRENVSHMATLPSVARHVIHADNLRPRHYTGLPPGCKNVWKKNYTTEKFVGYIYAN